MSFVDSYFVLLGAGEDEGWMQILVFVVMAVIWAIGGIMKARADKQKEQGKREGQPVKPKPVQNRPVRRPQQVTFQKKRVTGPQARPSQQKPVVHPTFDSVFAPEKMKPKIAEKMSLQQRPVEPKIKPAVMLSEPIEATTGTEMAEDEKEKAGAAMAEDVLNFGEPEQLRAAIIHYEIFGKCVGARPIQEQIWMR